MARRNRWPSKRQVGAGAGVAIVLGMVGMRAWSQSESFRLLSEAIVGPTTAYVPLDAEFLCATGANVVTPSPDGTDALIVHTVTEPPRDIDTLLKSPSKRQMDTMNSGRLQIQMLLLSQGESHAQVVWRGGGTPQLGFSTPGAIRWLPGTRLAIISSTEIPGASPGHEEAQMTLDRQTQTFLLVNGATGKIKTLVSGPDAYTLLLVSHTNPAAALVNVDKGTVQRIEPNGTVGPLLHYEKPNGQEKMPGWYGFLPDGRTLSGSIYYRAQDGKPSRRIPYRFDTVTGALSEADKDENAPGLFPPPSHDADLPLKVERDHKTLTRDNATADVYPLWLEGAGKDTTGRTLIASDSDPDFRPVLLTSAILYRKNGALYAVPLLKSNTATFLAKRQEALKEETLRRARALNTALLMYAQDYDGNLPLAGSDIKTSVYPYVKNGATFENPATGLSGFKPAYSNTALSSFTNPATTPIGYFAGPGGMVVIMYPNGQVALQGAPSSP